MSSLNSNQAEVTLFNLKYISDLSIILKWYTLLQWRTEPGGEGSTPPPPEIPKALQNRAKLNPTVKTV